MKIYKPESNSVYFTLIIGNYRKDYLTMEEAKREFQDCNKGDLFKLPKNLIGEDYDTIEENFRTEDNFYGNEIINGKDHCTGSFYYNQSNIDICSILLAGNDDYSITQEFYSYKEALKVWNRLNKNRFVNKSDLPDNYFSN